MYNYLVISNLLACVSQNLALVEPEENTAFLFSALLDIKVISVGIL